MPFHAPYAIAAASAPTTVGATVRIGFIAVVALLAFIQVAVTATLQSTSRRAAITEGGVSIIASFIASIVRTEVAALNSVAAASIVTSARTGVSVEIITVIAGLTLIDATVAADLSAATGRAAIASVIITVVAFLKTVFFGL